MDYSIWRILLTHLQYRDIGLLKWKLIEASTEILPDTIHKITASPRLQRLQLYVEHSGKHFDDL